jgi:tRNA-specific 2-thiouridylase
VLHVLSQYQLRHALFPLGEYTKPEVRAMAAERGLPVATKAESQEICFVAANDYRGFVRRYAEANGKPAPESGPILDLAGRQVGAHSGLANFTVGQRKGLGISAHEPLHVLRLDSARNAVIVGPAAALERDHFTVHQTTWTRDTTPDGPVRVEIKVRYKAQPVRGLVTPLSDGRAEVALEQPIRAVTPGQAAVFYGGADGDEALGGGLIE